MDVTRVERRPKGMWAAVCAAVMLAACGSTPKDETDGMSVEKLYSEARDEASNGGYERAIRLYERLEGRAGFDQHHSR